jgi:hypothetical protein
MTTRKCTKINSKIHWRSAQRYFMRTGILSRIFTQSRFLTAITSNIYKCEDTGKIRRLTSQFRRDALFMRYNEDAVSRYFVQFYRRNDRDSCEQIKTCWEITSQYDISYSTMTKFALLKLSIQSSLRNEYSTIHSSAMLADESDDETFYFLILSWFDRIDRMVFSRHLSSSKFCQSLESLRYDQLIIFVNKYL